MARRSRGWNPCPVGFSLQAVDADGGERDEYLSLSNPAMGDLRRVVSNGLGGEGAATLHKLAFNDGERVEPEECRWLARHLRRADHRALAAAEPEPGELLGLMDELERFCGLCAGLGGFEVR
jgi:hypothetical protein